jgi:hypothetical protein
MSRDRVHPVRTTSRGVEKGSWSNAAHFIHLRVREYSSAWLEAGRSLRSPTPRRTCQLTPSQNQAKSHCMRHLSSTRRSIHAAGVLLLLFAPLQVEHHHELDHDGATAHVEDAHGSHVTAVAEADARIRSTDTRASFDSTPASLVSVSPAARFARIDLATPWIRRPSRAPPPGSLGSRAPPHIS